MRSEKCSDNSGLLFKWCYILSKRNTTIYVAFICYLTLIPISLHFRCIIPRRVHTNGVLEARRSPSRTPPLWFMLTWKDQLIIHYSMSPSYLKFLTSLRHLSGSGSTRMTALAILVQPRLPVRPPLPDLPRSSPLPALSGGCGTELFSRQCCHTLLCFPNCRSFNLELFDPLNNSNLANNKILNREIVAKIGKETFGSRDK